MFDLKNNYLGKDEPWSAILSYTYFRSIVLTSPCYKPFWDNWCYGVTYLTLETIHPVIANTVHMFDLQNNYLGKDEPWSAIL